MGALLRASLPTRNTTHFEAVRKSNAAAGVGGADTIVLAVAKKSTPKLQDSRTVGKTVNLDNHITLACAGLKADAHVLINKACIERQRHRLTIEDPVTVEYITLYIAGLQQKYTQSGGVRYFGLSTLIIGFDPCTGAPSLYQTDPSGTFSAGKANATGRNSNSMRDVLEKDYKGNFWSGNHQACNLCIARGALETLLLSISSCI